jgi:RimJ/RimL family protein N-acetyltransferase
MHIRRYDDCDRSSVVALWEAAGLLHPNNDPYADIDRKTAESTWGFIVMAEAQRLLLERGYPKINLQVRAGNEPARRFSESLGYRERQRDIVRPPSRARQVTATL